MFCKHFERFFENVKNDNKLDTRETMLKMIEIGRKLNINMDFYKEKVDSLTGKIMHS